MPRILPRSSGLHAGRIYADGRRRCELPPVIGPCPISNIIGDPGDHGSSGVSWLTAVSRLTYLLAIRVRRKSYMLVRLTSAKRLMAGRVIALAYALCVLAPTLSFALPGSHAVSPCLTDANRMSGMMHFHADASTAHMHGDGNKHDHAGAHSHVDPSQDIAPTKASAVPEQSPSKGSHESGGQCCGLMCLTALPATLVEIVTPSVPTASHESGGYLEVADDGPPSLYRPPIT